MNRLGLSHLWGEVKQLPLLGKLAVLCAALVLLLLAANGLSNGLESYRRHRADAKQTALETENSELTRQRDGLRERADAAETRAQEAEKRGAELAQQTQYLKAEIENLHADTNRKLTELAEQNGICGKLAGAAQEDCVRKKLEKVLR